MPKPIYLLTLLLLPLLSVADADQIINSNVPDYWPNERYIVHNNGTVTDTNTSLMWMQCSLGLSGDDCSEGSASTYTWGEALDTAHTSSFANYTDWRLPNVKELASLLAHNRYNPAINKYIFPNTPVTFWSASPGAVSSGKDAWRLSFQQGTIIVSSSGRGGGRSVRLVRSTD